VHASIPPSLNHPHTNNQSIKMALDQYTYVFAIGTFFALLDAYNNGASKYPFHLVV